MAFVLVFLICSVGQKLSASGGYSVGQAQAIISEIRQLQQHLVSGQKERNELVQVCMPSCCCIIFHEKKEKINST